MIPDAKAFARTVESGIAAAEAGAVVTFGIVPDSPHTGYGYIETGAANGAALKVRRFVEKPSREAAEQFLDSGQFYWNGGIFLFKARIMLDLLKTHAPTILDGCQSSLAEVRTDLGFRVLNGAYSSVPAISLDYAIAEKADNLMCVPLATSWSDAGSWSSLWNFMDKDARGNAVSGSGQVIIEDTSDSFVFSDDGCVALVGVENLVVIGMQDAVLVASKDHADVFSRWSIASKGSAATWRRSTTGCTGRGVGIRASTAATGIKSSASWSSLEAGFHCRATTIARSIGWSSPARWRSRAARRRKC
jgi:mannose-1-phosphate guanylyltransferase/mannose-6-phosphate isomerase